MSESVPSGEQPVVEAPVVETAVPETIDHATTPSLLSQVELPSEPAVKTEAPTPIVEAPAEPVVETKPAEPAPIVETPAPEPVVYPEWKLPEGIQADKDTLGKYTETLAEFGVKPEAGQKLLDMHAAAIQTAMQQAAVEQHRIFSEIRKGWQDEIRRDPEIGGNGFDTAQGVIARMRDRLISDHPPGTEGYKKDRAAFDAAANMTGFGDHPLIHKMLYRVGKFLDEPSLPPANVGPAPNGGKPPGKLRDAYTTMQK